MNTPEHNFLLTLDQSVLVSTTPHIGKPPGWGAGDSGCVITESLERSYPWAVGFFFGNTELSLELWTVISGISGFDD